VVNFASRFVAPFVYFNLLIKLVLLYIRQPEAIYHLRDVVSGLVFCLSRFCRLVSACDIYDLRGAFFIECREASKSRALSRLFGWAEAHLNRHAATNIVTSRRFATLYTPSSARARRT
jgi:hypothetical protein